MNDDYDEQYSPWKFGIGIRLIGCLVSVTYSPDVVPNPIKTGGEVKIYPGRKKRGQKMAKNHGNPKNKGTC